MKAAYKWRLDNNHYSFIVDETGNMPLILDSTDSSFIEREKELDEKVPPIVGKMAKDEYCMKFDAMTSAVSDAGFITTFLDCDAYYNIDNDACVLEDAIVQVLWSGTTLCVKTDGQEDYACRDLGVYTRWGDTTKGEPATKLFQGTRPQGNPDADVAYTGKDLGLYYKWGPQGVLGVRRGEDATYGTQDLSLHGEFIKKPTPTTPSKQADFFAIKEGSSTTPKAETQVQPTFSVGTIREGATNVELVTDGAIPNYKMNFTLPRGSQGAVGAQGVQGARGVQGPRGESGGGGSTIMLRQLSDSDVGETYYLPLIKSDSPLEENVWSPGICTEIDGDDSDGYSVTINLSGHTSQYGNTTLNVYGDVVAFKDGDGCYLGNVNLGSYNREQGAIYAAFTDGSGMINRQIYRPNLIKYDGTDLNISGKLVKISATDNVVIQDAILSGSTQFNGNATFGQSVTFEDIYCQNGYATGGFFEHSDIRKKNIISDVKDIDIEKIIDLSLIYFTFKDDEKAKRQIGVIAQEIKQICPELVTEDEDGYLSVDYGKLSILALYCIKDIYEKIGR